MKPDRFVVDTNVLISAALLAHSVPARCVAELLRRGRLVFSVATFAELDTRLWRPKFDRYVSIEDRKLLLHDLGAAADWVDPPANVPVYGRDRADDKFVPLALTCQAAALVTGDADLLVLGPVDGLTVMTPALALKRFGPAS